jgi:hypothetical protein
LAAPAGPRCGRLAGSREVDFVWKLNRKHADRIYRIFQD